MRRPSEHAHERDDLQQRAAPAARAPATAADRVLGLQGSAGNRAVTALLARDGAKPAPKEGGAPPVTGPRVIIPGLGTIPVLSWTLAATSPAGLGAGGPKRKATPQELHFSSKLGDHSALLSQALMTGKPFNAQVFLNDSGTVIRLEDAVVSNYGPGPIGDPPLEAWSINAKAVEFVQPKQAEEPAR